MSGLSRGQKFRLGLFLLFALVILGGTLLSMVGLAAFEKRDEYIVRFDGSVSGLSRGSAVKYNGIQVGRVERIRIDPKNVSGVEITLSLDHGTPVKESSVAVLNFQGITGLKFIELTGGKNDDQDLPVGSEIKSERSTVDLLTDKAVAISNQIETLLANLVKATSGENARLLTQILTDVHDLSSGVTALVTDNRKQVQEAIASVNRTAGKLESVVKKAVDTMETARTAMTTMSQWVKPNEVSQTLKTLQKTVERLQATAVAIEATMRTAEKRLGKQELGVTIAHATMLMQRATGLVERADVTLLRARDDILRALDALVTGAESFAELATTLRNNPSALIRGSDEKDRELP